VRAASQNRHTAGRGFSHDADYPQPFLVVQSGRFSGGSAGNQEVNAVRNLPFHQLAERFLIEAAIAAKGSHECCTATAEGHTKTYWRNWG
jgi:hypothetical protein